MASSLKREKKLTKLWPHSQRKRAQINKIRNETEITTDTIQTQRIIKKTTINSYTANWKTQKKLINC